MKAVNGLFDDLENNTHHLHGTAEFQAKMVDIHDTDKALLSK